MSYKPATKRKWVPIVLVISLALNLLVAGAVLGTVLRFRGGDHVGILPGFGPALYAALPKDDRKALRGELAGKRVKGSDRRKQDFAALSQVLQAVPFDPNAVATLLQQQAQAASELQAALHRQWLNQVTAMSDEERAVYAQRLQEVVERGPKRKKKKD